MKAIRLNEHGVVIVIEAYNELEGQIAIKDEHLPLAYQNIQDNQDPKYFEMQSIREWLTAHDYIVNKHTLGEYADDDERWVSYLQERQVKLARYNELEQQAFTPIPFDLTLLTPIVEEIFLPEDEEVDPTYEELLDEDNETVSE